MKLSTTQARAQRFCSNILSAYATKDYVPFANISVEWKKSAMYGNNPVISSHEGKMTSVSGCGYCKLSTALADVLCFLFPVSSPEYRKVMSTGGCGESTVIRVLNECGWNLERTSSGKAFDGYRLTRKAVTA